jgi:hypothetical protein
MVSFLAISGIIVAFGKLDLLDYAYFFSYVKLAITLMKYFPQVFFFKNRVYYTHREIYFYVGVHEFQTKIHYWLEYRQCAAGLYRRLFQSFATFLVGLQF